MGKSRWDSKTSSMESTVLILPDPDWVVVKSPKYNGSKGNWYTIRHKHSEHAFPTTYNDTSGGVNQQYKCAWCNIDIPEAVSGFRNLIQWSEV